MLDQARRRAFGGELAARSGAEKYLPTGKTSSTTLIMLLSSSIASGSLAFVMPALLRTLIYQMVDTAWCLAIDW
jgi:hypothetical protein